MSLCIQLDLHKRNVLIVGGGEVAYRKACQFIKEGAHLTVISPEFRDEFSNMDAVLIKRRYRRHDCKAFFYVYAASDDKEVNAFAVRDANENNILCGCAMAAVKGSASSMVSFDEGGILCAVSTCGQYPLLNACLKDDIQEFLHMRYGGKVRLLSRLRAHTAALPYAKEKKNRLLKALTYLNRGDLLFLSQAVSIGKAMILAFHGVSDSQQVHRLYERCERFAHDDPHRAYGFCFLSEKICDDLHGKVMTANQMLSFLKELQISDITVCPMLLEEGRYYQTIAALCAKEHIACKKPLLSDEKSVHRILEFYVHTYQRDDQLLFVTHDTFSLEAMLRLKKLACRFSDVSVCPCSQIPDLKKDIPVTILPFVMLMGHHASCDILYGTESIQQKLHRRGYKTTIVETAVFDQKIVQQLYEAMCKEEAIN